MFTIQDFEMKVFHVSFLLLALFFSHFNISYASFDEFSEGLLMDEFSEGLLMDDEDSEGSNDDEEENRELPCKYKDSGAIFAPMSFAAMIWLGTIIGGFYYLHHDIYWVHMQNFEAAETGAGRV